MYIYALIGQTFTKAKFRSIWEKGEKEYRDGLTEPDQSREYTCLWLEDEELAGDNFLEADKSNVPFSGIVYVLIFIAWVQRLSALSPDSERNCQTGE